MITAYLAIKDKEIEKKQQEVKKINKEIIAKYYELPFWKRMLDTSYHEAITYNWVEFDRWMTKRMEQMSRVANKKEPQYKEIK